MSAAKNRRDRLGGQVRAVLAQCLLLEVKDPGLRSVDITDVLLSPDLGHAKVYYYARGSDAELLKIDKALERAKGFLRRRVGQEIRARLTPELAFYYDDSIERGAYIETLLSQVKAQDEAFAVEHRGTKASLSDLADDSSVDDSSVDDSSVDDSSVDDSSVKN